MARLYSADNQNQDHSLAAGEKQNKFRNGEI